MASQTSQLVVLSASASCSLYLFVSLLSRLCAFWLVLHPFWFLLHLGLVGPRVFHCAIWHYLVCAIWHYSVCAIRHDWPWPLIESLGPWVGPFELHNLCREYPHWYSR